jgi:hypothetical protein
MEGDAYIRLSAGGPRHWGHADSRTDLVFVDLAHKSIDKLRQVPHDVLRRLGVLLVRVEPTFGGQEPPSWVPTLDDVEKIAERLGLKCRVGLLHQPVGEPARVEGDFDDGERDDLLARAKAIELSALLEWGDAIWKPTGFHYRLPSGEHSDSFVKLADAIGQPRDAQVLASWLNCRLGDGLGIVADAAGLVSVVESLRATARAAGLREGPISVLTGYPATEMAVHQAVSDALTNEGRILALVSVNASGRLADRLFGAMQAQGGGLKEWNIEILVDRRQYSVEGVSIWLPGPRGSSLLGERHTSDESCRWCQDRDMKRVVPINPISFDGMVASQRNLLMPNIRDAGDNRALWEACNAAGAVGLVEAPDDDVAVFRPSPNKMPIHFRLGKLVGNQAYRDRLAEKVEQLLTRQRQLEEQGTLNKGLRLSGQADLILIPKHEYEQEGYEELWKLLAPLLAATHHDVMTFNANDGWDGEDCDARVAAASDILVFALGLVTGGSVTTALAGVQRVRADQSYELAALVAHARPSRKRAWETLGNAYSYRLFEVWLSFLPEHSPMQDELAILDAAAADELGADAVELFDQRKAMVSGSAGSDPTPMFWGSRVDDVLSPHSLYGKDLDGATTFVAVGAAMERARQCAQVATVPELRVFELQALFTSYFDRLIVASILRWLRPEEAWWGETDTEAQTTMEILLRGADDSDLRVLIPELLLAIAQGKVTHSKAIDAVYAKVEEMGAAQLDDDARAALELGLLAAGDKLNG